MVHFLHFASEDSPDFRSIILDWSSSQVVVHAWLVMRCHESCSFCSFFPKLEPCWRLCSCLQVSPWKPPDALDGSASIKTFLVKEFVEIESTWCCGWRSSILSMEPPAVRSLSFDKLALRGLCRQITLVVLSLSCFFSVFLSCWFFLLFFLFRFFFWGESSTSRARADGALATNASWWPASHVHPYMVLDDMTGLSDSFEASMLLSRSTVDFLMAPFLVVHGGCCCCWWWWWCCCLLLVCAVFFGFFLPCITCPQLEVFVQQERRCAMHVMGWVDASNVELERYMRREIAHAGWAKVLWGWSFFSTILEFIWSSCGIAIWHGCICTVCRVFFCCSMIFHGPHMTANDHISQLALGNEWFCRPSGHMRKPMEVGIAFLICWKQIWSSYSAISKGTSGIVFLICFLKQFGAAIDVATQGTGIKA